MGNNAVLSGNLTFLSLAELLQLLGSNTSTGVLRITNKYASEPGVVFFVKGNPVHALNDKLSGLEAIFSLFGWSQGEFSFSEEGYEGQTTINKSRMAIILPYWITIAVRQQIYSDLSWIIAMRLSPWDGTLRGSS